MKSVLDELKKKCIEPENATCGDVYRICPFFPNMEVPVGEWTLSQDGTKVRKSKKTFVCFYCDEKLDWKMKCPYVKTLLDREKTLDISDK